MYGEPVSSVPTSSTRATCSLFEPHGGPRLAQEAAPDLGVVQHLGEQELDRDPLAELEVRGRDDDAHAALAEHALDAVLAQKNLTDEPSLTRRYAAYYRESGDSLGGFLRGDDPADAVLWITVFTVIGWRSWRPC